jgi:hypothetical protein
MSADRRSDESFSLMRQCFCLMHQAFCLAVESFCLAGQAPLLRAPGFLPGTMPRRLANRG